jgi:hypothetical protein
MSELAAVPTDSGEPVVNAPKLSRKEQYLSQNAERMEAEYGDKVAEEETDSEGTPVESAESEPGIDDAPGAEEIEASETDTEEDGTPEEDDEGEDGYEERYKELQATYTETSQELAELRTQRATEVAEYTQASHALSDKYGEAEQISGYFQNMAAQELTQLQQVNPQTLNQEQFAQWQQAMNAAGNRVQHFNTAVADVKDKAEGARKQTLARQVEIARRRLDMSIPNFDEEYSKIGEFAVSRGVDQKVFQDITDPVLIEMIHEARTLSETPDVIENLTRKTQAKKSKTRNAVARDTKGRYKAADRDFRNAKTPAQRKKAFVAREQERFEREYGR